MRDIQLLDAAKFTSPNPLRLICTRTPKGATNLGAALKFAESKSGHAGSEIRD